MDRKEEVKVEEVKVEDIKVGEADVQVQEVKLEEHREDGVKVWGKNSTRPESCSCRKFVESSIF